MRYPRYSRIPNDYFSRSGLTRYGGQRIYSEAIKPFLMGLIGTNRTLRRINSQFGRLDHETGTSHGNGFHHDVRKSEKLAHFLFRTIDVLDQEIRSLKGMIYQKKTKEGLQSKKTFEIDSITIQLVRELEKKAIYPVYTTPAFIYILDDPTEIDVVLDTVANITRFVKGGLRAVGLDVETGARQHYSSFPSILQVAINKDIVIIFQLYQLCFKRPYLSPNLDVIPESLKKLLFSPSILKVGVNIRKDANQLEKRTGLKVVNSLCLQDIGNVLSLKNCSLKHLSHDYVGMKLNKGTGNYDWDSPKHIFSRRSAEYAANDVISSLLIFRKMISMPGSRDKNQAQINYDSQSVRPSADFSTITNDTQFFVNSHKKIKNRPPYLEKRKYTEIHNRITEVAHKKPVSFAKLLRIILYTCIAFPKDDSMAKIKAQKLILHLLNEESFKKAIQE